MSYRHRAISTANSCRSRKATVPVLDRGFIFGDGVYEVDARLFAPAVPPAPSTCGACRTASTACGCQSRCADAEWTKLIREIVARNAGDDQSVYCRSRAASPSATTQFPNGVQPTVFMMTSPLVTPARELVDNGVAGDHRHRLPLAAVRRQVGVAARQLPAASQAAVDAGAAEIVLFRDGYLTEARRATCSS